LPAAAAALALVAVQAAAQNYPTKPVRIIVPFAAGGGSDIVTRVLAQKLTESWGTTVVVENRPGAGGNIGMEVAAKSPPDGHTLVTGVFGPMAVNVSLFKSIGFDPVRDFAPITRMVNVTNLLVVHPSLPARSVKELVAVARRNPGGLNYASGGSGTAGHLAAELFNSMAGVKMVHIPYKGSGLSMADLVGGQTALSFDNMPATWPHVKSGRLRALGVTTLTRTAAAPEVPTIAEAGLPGFEATNWYSILGPAGTPRPIVDRLNRDVGRALSVPDARDRLAGVGAEVATQSPDEFAAFIRSEIDKWAKVIRAAGIKVE
jgi:tripartite-type tricarboxylate transporter receptor subunit TctC